MKNTIDYHKTQLMGTLSFGNHSAISKIDLVDPHRTKIGQNAPLCTVKVQNNENGALHDASFQKASVLEWEFSKQEL